MSIPNLPVNFKDDILAASNAKRKYQQTFNSDGSVSLEDVTVYTQKGSDFGASQVNQTNGAVNNIYDERILDLEELELVTEPGFFVDAQAAKEAYDALNSKTLVTKVKSLNGCQFMRSGNVVSFTFNRNLGGVVENHIYANYVVIPEGYRPAVNEYVSGIEVLITNYAGDFYFNIETTGKTNICSKVSHSEDRSYVVSGSYITNDQFPVEDVIN